MRIEKCKICGGTVGALGNKYIKCDYCGQIYSLDGVGLTQDEIYADAVELQNKGTIVENEQARLLFDGIPDYRDSNSKILNSYFNIERIKVEEEEKRLKELRKAEIDAERQRENEKRRKKLKRISIGICLVAIIILVVIFMSLHIIEERKMEQYDSAIEYYNNGQYEEAREVLLKLENYEDSKNYLVDINAILAEYQSLYDNAINEFNIGNYKEAILTFEEIKDYSDSLTYIEMCANKIVEQAESLIDVEDYEGAKLLISYIPVYSEQYDKTSDLLLEIETIILENKFISAINLYNNNQLVDAQKIFIEIREYKDTETYLDIIGNVMYEQAQSYIGLNDYLNAYSLLELINEKQEWKDYEQAVICQNELILTYVNLVNQQAIQVLMEAGWSQFEEYLNNSTNELYTANDASNLKKQYENYKPVVLDVTNYLSTNNQLVSFVGSGSDVLGNTFGQSIILSRCYVSPDDFSQYYYGGATLQYNVDGKYAYLSGTIACSSTNDGDGERKCENSLLIFADGKLVYSSENINYLSEPVDFKVNIENAKIITFINPVYHDGYLGSDILITNLEMSN